MCLPRRSIGNNEGRSDADDAPSGRGIQGDCGASSGEEAWKEDNQSTKLLATDLVPTADDSSVHDKERTWGCDGAAPAATGGDDGQEKNK